MSVTLFVRNGGLAGQTFTFNEPSIPIGRDKGNVLKLESKVDERASGKHCEIYEDNGAYYVRDVGSTNGTFVNNQRITAPVRISDGTLLKLGGTQGIEIVVKMNPDDTFQPTYQATKNAPSGAVSTAKGITRLNSAARSGDVTGMGAAPVKIGIGLRTLDAAIEGAKSEVRREHANRHKLLVAAMLAIALVGLGAGGFFLKKYLDTQKQIDVVTTNVENLGNQIALGVKEIDGVKQSVIVIKEKVAANEKAYNETVAQMAKAMSEKEQAIRKIQVSIESVDATKDADLKRKEKDAETLKTEFAKLQTMVQEVKDYQDNPANKQFQATSASAFNQSVATNRPGVYAVMFRSATSPEQTLAGTAFAIEPTLGLLATSGNLGHSVRDLLVKGQVFVVCNEKPFITYKVVNVKVHEDFTMSGGNRKSPDVAVLQVDLAGSKDAFPVTLPLLSNSDLEHVPMAQPVAMLGFPDEYKDSAANLQNTSLVAKLSIGVVSSTTRFSGVSASNRIFDILEHTCAVGANDEGSPIFDEQGRVIAIQSHSESELFTVVDKTDLSRKIVKKFSVGNVKYAVSVRFLRDLVSTNFGDSFIK